MKTLEYIMGAAMLLTPDTCKDEHQDMHRFGIKVCPVCRANLEEESTLATR
jgi:hypothetical protein